MADKREMKLYLICTCYTRSRLEFSCVWELWKHKSLGPHCPFCPPPTPRFWFSRSGWGQKISFLTSPQVMPRRLVPEPSFEGPAKWFPKCGPQSSSIGNNSDFVRITGFQTPSQRCWVRICFSLRFLGYSSAHDRRQRSTGKGTNKKGRWIWSQLRCTFSWESLGSPPQGTWLNSENQHCKERMHVSGGEASC